MARQVWRRCCGSLLALESRSSLGHNVLIPLASSKAVGRRSYGSSNLVRVLSDRGLLSQVFPYSNPTDDDAESKSSPVVIDQKFLDWMNASRGGEKTVYAGFDPTGPSLHVGHLAVLMALLHCSRAGVNVIALVGGATGMIGDPSGKSKDRVALDTELVMSNAASLTKALQRIFDNHATLLWDDKQGKEPLKPLRVVNNLDWWGRMSALEFVGQVGRHFRMGTMLLKDSVKGRLGTSEGLSFTEFTYQIFQAYDWLHLLKTFNCELQIGGHDQMGNIQAGHEVVSRMLRKQVFGLTVPLVTTESGEKLGKTGGAVGDGAWLSADRSPPFAFYQWWIRTPDSDLRKMLNLFTFRRPDEINSILSKHEKSPEKRTAQKLLAEDVTLLVHGREGLEEAKRATDALYGESVEALAALEDSQIASLFGGSGAFREILLTPGTTVLDMALKAKCFSNERDATRIITGGGFFLNHTRVTSTTQVVVPGVHILPNKISLARVGKKNYTVIKWSP